MAGYQLLGAVLIFRITLNFPWHLSFCWPISYSSVLNYVCPPQFTRVNLTRLLLSKLYQLCIVIHPVRHRCKCPSTVDVHETASDRRTCSNNGDRFLPPCLPVKVAYCLSLRCSIELQILIPDTELQWFESKFSCPVKIFRESCKQISQQCPTVPPHSNRFLSEPMFRRPAMFPL